MLTFKTVEELTSAIAPRLKRIHVIDGFPSSGKTTLSSSLANNLDLVVVHTDDFVKKNQGSYFEHFKFDELTDYLAKTSTCLFEGICALKILKAVNIEPDLIVYVKQMTKWGWIHQDELEIGYQSQLNKKLASLVPDEEFSFYENDQEDLLIEVAEYHRAFLPHEKADFIYERFDI